MTKDIILITNNKGGVGKTTIALLFAHSLAYQGYKTLLIDGDIDQWDSYYYSTGEDNPISGEIKKTEYGFDVVWISIPEDVPSGIVKYDWIIIDGRPNNFVNIYFTRNASHIFIPYDKNERSYQNAERYYKMVKKVNPLAVVQKIANKGAKAKNNKDAIFPYDKGIEKKGWLGASEKIKQSVIKVRNG